MPVAAMPLKSALLYLALMIQVHGIDRLRQLGLRI